MNVAKLKNVTRRELIELLGLAGAGLAVGCGSSPTTPSATSTTTTAPVTGGGTTPSSCAVAPSETEGPYPDKTGMINNPAFFRRDVREGKSGLPLTLALTIVNVNASCSAVANANIEIWQCDASGGYSEYAQPGFDGTGQTFLRGVQTTDGSGQVAFTTIYPGWYMGRATHIHIDVYISGRLVKTTQIAFPEDVTRQVYSTGVYASRGQNSTTNASDSVFSDGTSGEMAALSGDTTNGYTATLTVGIAV